MPSRCHSGQFCKRVRIQNVGDEALLAMLIHPLAVGRDDAAGFLAAMLQGKKAKLSQRGGLRVAEDTENAALLMKFVEREAHFFILSCSYPPAVDSFGKQALEQHSPLRELHCGKNSAATFAEADPTKALPFAKAFHNNFVAVFEKSTGFAGRQLDWRGAPPR